MIAFHYPPCAGSTGLQRALKFSRYLPDNGWEPIVLSANPMAYPRTSDNQVGEIPDDIVVARSFCLDAARHLSIAGRYPKPMAMPDRWSSWQYAAIRTGRRLIEKYRPQVIWSTYPIATAQLIASRLHQASGIPWIADFRDSMTEPGYPADPAKRKLFLDIERTACEQSRAVVFTAPGAIRMYAERYPDLPADRWVEIANGYDDANFPAASDRGSDPGRISLVHSGVIYPSERDPTQFFDALAHLKRAGHLDASRLRVVLRATGHDAVIGPMLESRGITDIVSLEPPVDYSDALQEMMNASGLLLFQAANCNHQIPAKLYEYMRAGKPVFGMTDPAGDTAGKMREAGLTDVVPLDDQDQIERGLLSFLSRLREGRAAVADAGVVRKYSREYQTVRLAELFDTVIGANSA